MSAPGGLVKQVDYRRLAAGEQVIRGRLDLAALPRVAALTTGAAGAVVDIELAFAEDRQRRVRITGRIDTVLSLLCQRCLRGYAQQVHAPVAGVVVTSDAAAANLPRADEPVLADADMLDIDTLVGDELLLALPAVARCGRPDCSARFERDRPAGEPEYARRSPNPFAVLRERKREH